MKVTKAVIPVAGKGTRFLPATKGVAKEMFPVVDKPCLMLVLEECLNSGINDITIILSKEKSYIKEFFKKDNKLEKQLEKKGLSHLLADLNKILENITFHFTYQDENIIGSGGSIYSARHLLEGEPFAVLYPDDLNYTEPDSRPAIGQLIDAYEKTGKMIIGCKEVSADEIYKYSACKVSKKINDSLYEITDIVEKPKKGTEPSLISGLARYIMPANTFDYLEKQVKSSSPGVEIGLTDTMSMILKDEPAYALIMQSTRYDTGDKLGYLTAVIDYALRDEKLGKDVYDHIKKLFLKK